MDIRIQKDRIQKNNENADLDHYLEKRNEILSYTLDEICNEPFIQVENHSDHWLTK